MPLYELLIILGLVFLNGLFSMAELAVVSARRSRLEKLVEEGSRRAKIALELASNPNTFLATVQIGITLIGILAGVYGGAAVAADLATLLVHFSISERVANALAFSVIVLLITYLSLVIGELVPKRLALSYPETIAVAISPVLLFVSKVFSPIVWILDWSTTMACKFFPFKLGESTEVTEDDMKSMIVDGHESGLLEKSEKDIFQRVFRLADRPATVVMTPRKELIWLDINSDFNSLWQKALSNPHSHFPVGDGSADKIIGIVSIKDLALLSVTSNTDESSLRSQLREPLVIPATASVLKVLEAFKAHKRHIAVLVDEYGGTDGIVTVHNLLEAIVGDLGDHDQGVAEILARPDGSFLVDASVDLEEMLLAIGVEDIQSELREKHLSLSGLILDELGELPHEGQVVEVLGLRLEVVDIDGSKMDKILVSLQK